ncbi:MAG: sigma-70 family RNA polymerase sigma factor [Lachnospiraceae bacterium]|nr:sigma-70 family RNA polymerase sigma factor [Lachnospiraceae bacterium]
MNREEYERIVALYADVVFRVALSYAKTKEDAEDVLQNVFLKLLTKRVKFEDDEHIRKWLIRVAVNECNSLWSSFWRKNVEYIDRMEEGITFQNADYSDLYDAIKVLPAKLRIVLHLFYYEGYRTKEIADLLHIREATVRSRLTRARKLLKSQLGEYESEYSPFGCVSNH